MTKEDVEKMMKQMKDGIDAAQTEIETSVVKEKIHKQLVEKASNSSVVIWFVYLLGIAGWTTIVCSLGILFTHTNYISRIWLGVMICGEATLSILMMLAHLINYWVLKFVIQSLNDVVDDCYKEFKK